MKRDGSLSSNKSGNVSLTVNIIPHSSLRLKEITLSKGCRKISLLNTSNHTNFECIHVHETQDHKLKKKEKKRERNKSNKTWMEGYRFKMSRGEKLCLFKLFSKENNTPDCRGP